MTHVAKAIRIALSLGFLQLASCASTAATNRMDDLQNDGGGSGDRGTGGGGSDWWECPAHLLSCREGVVYDIFSAGRVPPGTSCKPHAVSTCPYGCNPDWHELDAASRICNQPPPGCDDGGRCAADGGRD